MLAEDDDPDLWMRRPQLACEANPVVGVARGHPDVREDEIGLVPVDGHPKLVHVGTDRHELDVLDRFEQGRRITCPSYEYRRSAQPGQGSRLGPRPPDS